MFVEMICQAPPHNEDLLRHMRANRLNAVEAAKMVNADWGGKVCEIHSGALADYQDNGPERCTSAVGMEGIPTHVTSVYVQYKDGFSGYVWRFRFTLKGRP